MPQSCRKRRDAVRGGSAGDLRGARGVDSTPFQVRAALGAGHLEGVSFRLRLRLGNTRLGLFLRSVDIGLLVHTSDNDGRPERLRPKELLRLPPRFPAADKP